MGVSGSGKSTIGAALATALHARFIDGDSLHPASNVAKMSAGTPLDDLDRAPWLAKVGECLQRASDRGTGLVVACSALKRSYRDAIRTQAPRTFFAHLDVDRELLQRRMSGREHFMPVSLLDSQLAALEPLEPAEYGVVVAGGASVADLVRSIAGFVGAAR